MLQTKQRIAWLDIAKAITILLVVFGHTLRGGTTFKIVYSFHVATFFLLSGMTCKTDQLKERIKKDVLRILVPYYCFSVLSILIFFFLGNFAADKLGISVDTSLWNNLKEMFYGCPVRERLKYNMPLWFLPCLFATKMLYYGLNKLCKEKPIQILVWSLVLAAVGVTYTRLGGPGLPFNLSVALKMLFFFSLGRVLFPHLDLLEKWQLQGAKAIVLGVLILLVTGIVAYLAPKVDYADDSFPNFATFLITAITGSFGVCFLSIGIGNCKVLEYVGMNTLAILVMHKFPVLLFQTVGPQASLFNQDDSVLKITLALTVSLISIGLCLIAGQIIQRCFPFLLGDIHKHRQWIRRS